MKWSQTVDTVTLILAVCDPPATYTPVVNITADRVRVTIDNPRTNIRYEVDAPLFAEVDPVASSWRVLGNLELLVNFQKAEFQDIDREDEGGGDEADVCATPISEFEHWSFPFRNRAYKGFTQIDWARWVDADAEDDDDDDDRYKRFDDTYDAHGYAPLGAVKDTGFDDFMTSADSSGDSLPTETNPEFAEMLQKLTAMGSEPTLANRAMPSPNELPSNMTAEELQTVLNECTSSEPTHGEGTTSVNVKKIATDEVVI